eukprot:TRINITY_DN6732_c0_g1_i5.p1 TRINITY_DN6732_c0_g1~~TRINITY_DN6732_c0_g1_i5.p1  ORF type:complete len:265 (-),score=54.18 TRINITY_DN6732_c0_g1_i5:14-808(-)
MHSEGMTVSPKPVLPLTEHVHRVHLYTSDDANHMLVALYERTVQININGKDHFVCDTAAMISIDGKSWTRTSNDKFLPGKDVVSSVEEGNKKRQSSIAFLLGVLRNRVSIFRFRDSREGLDIARFEVRRNGWMYLDFPMCPNMYDDVKGFQDQREYITIPGVYRNEVITKPMLAFNGSRVLLNFAGSIVTHIYISVTDVHGVPLKGLEGSVVLWGNYLQQEVQWAKDQPLMIFQEMASPDVPIPIRLKFSIEGDAKVYSFQIVK